MVVKHKYLPEPIVKHNSSNISDEYEIYEITKNTKNWFSILKFYYNLNKSCYRVPLLVRIINSHNIRRNNYVFWGDSIINDQPIYLICKTPSWVFVNLDNIKSGNMSFRELYKEELNIIFKKNNKPTII